MKTNEASFFVFIAAVIVGILIASNLSFSNKSSISFLDAKQYQDALNQKLKLQNDISKLEEEYNENSVKLAQYKSVGLGNEKVLEEMQSELNQNKMLIGQTKLHGQGIKIQISDADPELVAKDPVYFMIHDYDMGLILNDLRAAGAEAIAINGERVWDRTGFNCGGLVIDVNNVQVYAPFTIEAIGNKKAMNEYMWRDDGYLKFLSLGRNMNVSPIEEEDDIVIPAYSGNVNVHYSVAATGNK